MGWVDCWEQHGGELSANDKKSVLDRKDAYHNEEGLGHKESLIKSLQWHHDQAHAQLQSIYDQVGVKPASPEIPPPEVSETPTGTREGGAPQAETTAPEVAHDWTEATQPLKPFKPKTEGGFLGSTSGTIKSIAIKKRRALDAATGIRSERLQKSFTDAQRAQKEIRKAAPTDRRQNAISVWMEAGGNVQTIDQWASQAKGKMFKQAAEDARNLTPQEIAIAQKARGAFDVLENRGNTYGVLNNHRDNYVPHIWDVDKKFTGIGSSKLQDRFKFSKARTFDTFFDGDQAGFIPKTMAIGKVLPSYLTEMNKVIADRQFIQDVSSMTASDKRPLVTPRGNAKTVGGRNREV